MDYKDYQEGATKDHFWFRAKNELIGILLNKMTGDKTGLKILNVGAGTGDDLHIINKFGEIYVLDIDPNSLELISDDLVAEKKVCDVCRIVYPDSYFDLVVAFDVMEHIENDTLAANEIYRVLKPQGFFIFTVPAYKFLYSSHDRALRHFRRYSRKEIRKLLSGFDLLELRHWGCSIFLPIFMDRKIKGDDFNYGGQFKLPKLINMFFYVLMKAENWCIQHGVPLPGGTTIYGICQKH